MRVARDIYDAAEPDGKRPTPSSTPWPEGYCQWALTNDCMGLEWDGNEKFYDYVECLQAVMDNILKPAAIELTGSVTYQGEEIGDSGVIRIVDGVAVKEEAAAVIVDLQEFKDHVMASEYGEELMESFQRKRR